MKFSQFEHQFTKNEQIDKYIYVYKIVKIVISFSTNQLSSSSFVKLEKISVKISSVLIFKLTLQKLKI